MTEQQIAFELKWDLTEVREWPDDDYCAELSKQSLSVREGDKIRSNLWDAKEVEFPREIIFESNDALVRDCDYPYTNTRWPIMSQRMIDVLLSVGEFPHQALSLTFREIQLLHPRLHPDLEIGPHGLARQITEREFYLLNLLELLDVFDWDKSKYQTRQGRLVTSIRNIEKLVFKVPPHGLPPIFRPKELETCLFVSNAAKEALEKAGIKGARFVPQRKYR